jgi:uncharacterized protein (DUF983 family)
MKNPYSAPKSNPQAPHTVSTACPKCGHSPTATQYVFYLKPKMLKCKECKTELKYVVPGEITILLILFGAASAALTVPFVLPAGWPFIATYTVILFLLVSYAEAIYVQKRFPPVLRES